MNRRYSSSITNNEIDRVYKTFERAIDKLSQVLSEHSLKQEQMNEKLELKIVELERERRIKEIELDRRITNLELDKQIRDKKSGLLVKWVTTFPKIFGLLFLGLVIGLTRIFNEVTTTAEKTADSKLQEIRALESADVKKLSKGDIA